MWSLLPMRLQLLSIVVPSILFVLAIEAAVEMKGGVGMNPLRNVSFVVFLIGTVLTSLANFLWRHIWRYFPAIERATFPDLNGSWEGNLVTTWTDPSTKPPPPIKTKTVIKQTLFSTAVTLQTDESQSCSTRCYLEADRGAGIYRLWYSYDNRPKAEVRYRSARHEGVAWLELDIESDRIRLVGQYFTERRTTGDMDLRRAT